MIGTPDDLWPPPEPTGFIIIIPAEEEEEEEEEGDPNPPPAGGYLPDSPKTAALRVVDCVHTGEGAVIKDVAEKISDWQYEDLGTRLGAYLGSGHDNDGDGSYDPVHISISLHRELIEAIADPQFARPTTWEVLAHTTFHELVHAEDLDKCMREATSRERAELCSGNPALGEAGPPDYDFSAPPPYPQCLPGSP